MTPEHVCNYLPDKKAKTIFADPDFPMNEKIYSTLSENGYRRNGKHVYKPQCQQCQACITIRLPIDRFIRNRNQKRNWTRNSDLEISKKPAKFSDEYFNLYQRYLAARHAGGGMDDPEPESYTNFFMTDWATTVFYEFRKKGKLLSVAVVDELTYGLSAIYTFFDPNESHRSLGRYAVLAEIELARAQGLQWLYLGFWIANCRKMKYKDEYQPLEYFYQDKWYDHPPENIN